MCFSSAERDIKIVRPLYSVEVTETETARFETEISEEDVHGHWKLKGEALHQSPVRLLQCQKVELNEINVFKTSKETQSKVKLFASFSRTVRKRRREQSTF